MAMRLFIKKFYLPPRRRGAEAQSFFALRLRRINNLIFSLRLCVSAVKNIYSKRPVK